MGQIIPAGIEKVGGTDVFVFGKKQAVGMENDEFSERYHNKRVKINIHGFNQEIIGVAMVSEYDSLMIHLLSKRCGLNSRENVKNVIKLGHLTEYFSGVNGWGKIEINLMEGKGEL